MERKMEHRPYLLADGPETFMLYLIEVQDPEFVLWVLSA